MFVYFEETVYCFNVRAINETDSFEVIVYVYIVKAVDAMQHSAVKENHTIMLKGYYDMASICNSK